MSRHARLPHRRTVHRMIAVSLTLLLLIQTTGCVSWQPKANPVPSLHIAKATDTYRVILSGGMTYRLTNVRIHDDSVFGVLSLPSRSPSGDRNAGTTVGFPVSQVSSVEQRSDDTGRVVLVTLIVMSAFGFIVGKAMNDSWSSGWR